MYLVYGIQIKNGQTCNDFFRLFVPGTGDGWDMEEIRIDSLMESIKPLGEKNKSAKHEQTSHKKTKQHNLSFVPMMFNYIISTLKSHYSRIR